MTACQPRHGRHGWVNRARARLAAFLDWACGPYEEEAALTDDNGEDISDLLIDDEGVCGECNYQLHECPQCRTLIGHDGYDDHQCRGDVQLGEPDGWPEPDDGRTVAEAVRDAEAAEDDCPRPDTDYEITDEEFEAAKAHLLRTRGQIPEALQRVIDRGGRFGLPGDVPGSVIPSAGGPGYFHDDTPAGALQAVPLPDGTHLVKTSTEPRSYDLAEIDDTFIDARPEPRAGRSIWAPPPPPRTWVDDLIQSVLGVPTVELYMWGWQQRRAIAA